MMAHQYASDQPAGYENYIKKIAVVGAGGNLGKVISNHLLSTGQHSVTAITRHDSNSIPPAGVAVTKVSYDDPSSLVAALKGHDALIITMNVMAPPDTQTKLIDAAHAAGVSWIMPNEYGCDPTKTELQCDITFYAAQTKLREYIASKDGLSSVGLACGCWYEHSLTAFKYGFGFDVEKREVIFYDDGYTKVNTSTWAQCGRAIAKLFSLPILSQDSSDKRMVLDQFRNNSLYISSFLLDQNSMFDSILRVTGSRRTEWNIEHAPSKKLFEDGNKELAAGNMLGFRKMLYARLFYPDGCGSFEDKLCNNALGLPQEDLDEFTIKGIELQKTDYGKYGRVKK